MTKILITYRATIDRYVPVAIRSRLGRVSAPPKSRFVVLRERLRLSV